MTCPKCGIGRRPRIDTCGNCGLVLKIDQRAGAGARSRPGRRPVALRPPDAPEARSQLARSSVGTVIVVALAFAAHRRPRRPARQRPAARCRGWCSPAEPAFAGVVDRLVRRADRDRARRRSAPPTSSRPSPCRAAPTSSADLGRRARPVDRRPGRHRRPRTVGQHVRVHGRVRVHDPRPATCSSSGATRSGRSGSSRSASRSRCSLYATTPARTTIKPLVPALQNAPLLTIHVGMATIAYGIFATTFAAGVGYLIQGQGDRFALAAVAQGPRRGRVPGGDHRLPDLRDDDHPRLVVGLDRLVPLLGLGPEGDRGARRPGSSTRSTSTPATSARGPAGRPRSCSSSASGWSS